MSGRVQGWRFRFRKAGPPIEQAVRVGGAAREALLAGARSLGYAAFPDGFHHHGADLEHAHAHYLSYDADSDGRIDHLMVFAQCGIEDWLIAALARIDSLRVEGAAWPLSPDWMGRREPGGLFGPARVWTAITPFVTPKSRLYPRTGKQRPRFTPEAQLRAELRARNLPEPEEIALAPCGWAGDDFVLADAFDVRRGPARPPPGGGRSRNRPFADAAASFPTLTFAEPVAGPIAVGFGAHFGLGLFAPAAEQ